MRRHRVFLKDLREGEVKLSAAESQHLANVLRVKPGAAVRAFDGEGLEAEGEVLSVDGLHVTLTLNAPRSSEVEAVWRVTLAVALLKGDKMSDIIRMATELGAVRFIPVLSSRCDVRELSDNKLSRYRRVAQEAAKQSGRSLVPEVTEVVKLDKLPPQPFSLIAHPYSNHTLKERLEATPPLEGAELLVLTGPEGGFSDAEVTTLLERGYQGVRLGARILRAETAPVALLAALLLPEAL